MTDRKKPGVAFWATVGLVVVLAYVLSVGPAQWLVVNGWVPGWLCGPIAWFYWPLEKLWKDGPTPVHESLRWYYRLWQSWTD